VIGYQRRYKFEKFLERNAAFIEHITVGAGIAVVTAVLLGWL